MRLNLDNILSFVVMLLIETLCHKCNEKLKRIFFFFVVS